MAKVKIKDQVQALVNFWNATECGYCNRGMKVYFLDEDGTNVDVSGKPGKLCHSNLNGWVSCNKEKYKHRRVIGEVEAKAYIRIWGRKE